MLRAITAPLQHLKKKAITHVTAFNSTGFSSIGMATSSSSAAAAAAPLLNHGACEKLIDLVWAWDHMKMFHEPVTDEVVPGYSSVITDPIDLSTMRQKLARSGNATAAGASSSGTTAATSLYTCDTDVVNDLDLMVTNALTFNTPGTVWHSHAKALRKRVDPSALIGSGGEASAKRDDSGDFLVKSGVVIDEEELTYIESGTRRERSDYAKSMRKEEKKKTENISDVLSGMQEDLDIPIEELRKRFGNAAENLKKAQKRSREEDNGAADGSSSDSSSGSDDGSSGSDDDSEEDEESGSDDDEETSDSSDDEE